MPTIDVSMIARLDELGVPLSQRPVFEPPGGVSAPPPAARSPNPRAFEPPGTFGPPPAAAEAPLGVERSTRAIRIERQQREAPAPQAAAPARPSAPPRRSIGAIVAVVLIAAVAVGILLMATR